MVAKQSARATRCRQTFLIATDRFWQLAAGILAFFNGYLGGRGLSLRQGTIVDATLINSPSSTKNKDGKRDPEMHQTKKGNQYYFGMKARIGVDAESGLVHSVVHLELVAYDT